METTASCNFVAPQIVSKLFFTEHINDVCHLIRLNNKSLRQIFNKLLQFILCFFGIQGALP